MSILPANFLAALTAFGLCCSSPVFAQKNADAAQQQRVNRIFSTLRADVFPLPIPADAPCPAADFRAQKTELGQPSDLKTWLAQVEKMRKLGAADCCFELLDLLKPLAQRNDDDQLAWLYETVQTLEFFQKTDSALAVAQRFRGLAERTGKFQGKAFLAEARLRNYLRQFSQVNALCEKALAAARAEGDKRLEARVLSLLGATTRDVYMNQPDKFAPFHEQAIKIAEAVSDSELVASELLSLIYAYDETKEFDRQLDYFEQALAWFRPSFSLPMRSKFLRAATIFAADPPRFERTILTFEKSLELLKRLGSRSSVQNLYEQFSDIYFQKKDFDRALACMDSAQVYCDYKRELGYFYAGFAKIHQARGETAKANFYWEKAFAEQVRGYTNRNTQQLTEWETRFRTREKEVEIEQQKRQHWLLIGLAVLFALLAGGAIFAFFQQKKSRRLLAEQNQLIENQAAELRHLDEVKSRFFANVSHELRTPLTLMLGPLGSILKSGELAARNFAYAKTAQTNARELLKLVSEILDLSKMESGKMQVSETTVSLQPFLRRVVSAFESHAQRLGIEFYFEYRAPQRLRVAVDADKLTKIVNNLLSNALKFTPAGGSVTVTVEDAGGMIRLAVADTGRGIRAEDLPKVFDRFYQTSKPDAAAEGGTGIGLALCREFSELLKGKIWAESQVGAGSTFVFEFPKKETLGVASAEELDDFAAPDEDVFQPETGPALAKIAQPKTAAGALPKILLVEDNPSLRDYVKLILSDKYQVETAENGQEALEVLTNPKHQNTQTPKHNLIISDIMMPVMDGFQLLEKLKSDERWRQIPVVMLTARADAADKLKALRIGVDDYMLKPFDEEELLARVANLLKNASGRATDDGPVAEASEPNARFVNFSKVDKSTTLRPSAEELDWLAELEKTVEREVGKPTLNADALAETMLMSRTKFFQQVKRLTGITVNEYILEVRFRRARTMLENRQVVSVKSAAGAVGFRDVEYFSKQFRGRFGKAPSEYLG